jgi:uncharacterized protein YuzE
MDKPMVNYDRDHDILYLVIQDGEEDHFVETAEGIVVEFDVINRPIGIEISGASRVLFQAMDRRDLVIVDA